MRLQNILLQISDVADSYSKIAYHLDKLGHFEAVYGDKNFGKFGAKVIDCLEKMKKAEARAGTDQELKETDVLKYFTREIQAGKVIFSSVLTAIYCDLLNDSELALSSHSLSG
jgi:hypothetical protein